MLIRRDAGSGRAGLAGMAPVTETETLRLVRPLLSVSPERLRATLRRAGLGWAEDPSNTDPLAARTQARARLAASGSGDRLRLRVTEQVCEDGAWRRRRDLETAELLAQDVSLFPEGYAVLGPGPMTPAALAALIRTVSGSPYPARSPALARLASRWSQDRVEGTLGGVRFLPAGRLGPGLLAVREAAAMLPPIPARQGVLWDRRFQLGFGGALPAGAVLGALDGDAHRLRNFSGLPSAILRTLPALRAGDMLAVPHLGYFFRWTNRQVRLTLTPIWPLAGGAFGMGDAQASPSPYVP